MIMLQAAMAVGVIVAMVMVMVMVMMVVMMIVVVFIARVEKFRLEFEDAVEIEGAALQHVGQRHLAALGAVKFGVGVDGANPGLDLIEFGLGDEISLVEHDDVGKRDLVFGLGRVLQ